METHKAGTHTVPLVSSNPSLHLRFFFFLEKKSMYLCVSGFVFVYAWGQSALQYVCHSTVVEVRGQLPGINSLPTVKPLKVHPKSSFWATFTH